MNKTHICYFNPLVSFLVYDICNMHIYNYNCAFRLSSTVTETSKNNTWDFQKLTSGSLDFQKNNLSGSAEK